METNQFDWKSSDLEPSNGPSADFIKAVAELLETDAEDILAELGYVRPDDSVVLPTA